MENDDLPSIEPTTNRQEEERRGAGSGFFAALLSKLGLGGSSGAGVGGIGAPGVAGQGALLGGLLATKAGIVALVLAGSTVAAGIGIIGNEMGMFGSTPKLNNNEEGLMSVFDGSGNKKAAADPSAAKPAGGASDSLNYFSQANKGQIPDESALSSAQADAAASEASAVPDNANGPSNANPQARAKLAASKGFSSLGSGGGGGSSRVSGAGTAAGPDGVAKGQVGAMRSGGFKTSAANARMMPSVRSGHALGQAKSVKGDNLSSLKSNMPSSQSAGVTYDGAGNAGSIGGSQGISGGGSGVGGSGLSSGEKYKPNSSLDTKELPSPPKAEDTSDTTPWQWAIYASMAALGVALLAFLAMNFFKKKGDFATAKICAAIATAAAAVATMMGVLIMTMYGQVDQGLIWTITGGILTAVAAYSWFTMDDSVSTAQNQVSTGIQPTDNAVASKLKLTDMEVKGDPTLELKRLDNPGPLQFKR